MERNNITNASVTATYLDDVNVLLWQIVPPVLLVLGTFGNVMTVVVMRGMRASQSTACLSVYFTALALSDQCLLVVGVVWYTVDVVFSWPPSYFQFDLLCTIPNFVFYSCSLTSAWFLVAMTYQRVTSVVAPHRVGVLCTVRRGKMVVAVIVSAAFVINFHSLITFAYQPDHRDCAYQEEYANFIYLFTWLDLFWASVIPFALLIIGNSVLVWQVIRSMSLSRTMQGTTVSEKTMSGKSKVYPMSMTLILTSAAFLGLTLPVCVFHAYRRTLDDDRLDQRYRAQLELAESVCLFLWSGASASNFYLYFLSGSKFRQETKRYLCCSSNDDIAQKMRAC